MNRFNSEGLGLTFFLNREMKINSSCLVDINPALYRVDRLGYKKDSATPTDADYKEIIHAMREWDNSVAGLEIGDCYRRGQGVLKSYRKAVWYYLHYADCYAGKTYSWMCPMERLAAVSVMKLRQRLQACFSFYKAAPWEYERAYEVETGRSKRFAPYSGLEMWRNLTLTQLAEGLRRLTEYEEGWGQVRGAV